MGLLKTPLRHRKRRLVARLGAFALNGLNQRALFAANIAARTDENFQLEGKIRTQNPLAQQALLIAALDFMLQDVLLRLILVPDVQNAFARAGHQARDDHPFDHQVAGDSPE